MVYVHFEGGEAVFDEQYDPIKETELEWNDHKYLIVTKPYTFIDSVYMHTPATPTAETALYLDTHEGERYWTLLHAEYSVTIEHALMRHAEIEEHIAAYSESFVTLVTSVICRGRLYYVDTSDYATNLDWVPQDPKKILSNGSYKTFVIDSGYTTTSDNDKEGNILFQSIPLGAIEDDIDDNGVVYEEKHPSPREAKARHKYICEHLEELI